MDKGRQAIEQKIEKCLSSLACLTGRYGDAEGLSLSALNAG